ncbi:hypothetical protein ACQGAO_30390 [Rhodococcus sp. 1.20]|uniref:hypothetical protein n=1 Tax=Rhodococcus sp. OAS809 TaxID=2663874 RepID=UPI00178AF71F
MSAGTETAFTIARELRRRPDGLVGQSGQDIVSAGAQERHGLPGVGVGVAEYHSELFPESQFPAERGCERAYLGGHRFQFGESGLPDRWIREPAATRSPAPTRATYT